MKTRVMVSTTVTREIGEQLEDAARREHLSMSGYARKALLSAIGEQATQAKSMLRDPHSADDGSGDDAA